MTIRKSIAQALAIAVTLVLCGVPELMEAQQATAPPNSQAPTVQQDNGTVDPSRAPLEPVSPQSLPNAPSAEGSQSEMQQGTQEPRLAPQGKREQPAGAAVGQRGAVSGGAASKPAGNAIAPAKQRQARSLLIKAGLIGAAAIAVGTVVGLSLASSGRPPGAR